MDLTTSWFTFKTWFFKKTNTWEVSKENKRHWYWRGSWGEVTWRPGLALGINNHDKRALLHICLFYGNFYLRLKFLDKRMKETRDAFGQGWGFHFDRSNLYVSKGYKTSVYHTPWARVVVDRFVYGEDGKFHKEGTAEPYTIVRPFTYTTRAGEVQNVTATCVVKAFRLGWVGLKKLTFLGTKKISIDVKFSGPIGEGVDSWKGGTYGIYCTINKNETPEQALDRLEKEGNFR